MKDLRCGKKIRKSFSRTDEILEMPNLIEVQKKSYQWFLEEGLKEVLRDVSPITDYSGNLVLDFIDYHIENKPKYTIEECKERDVTYAAPLRVRARLQNKETGEIIDKSATPKFYKGASVTPVYEPLFLQINKLRQKVEAGAMYIQTQGIFDLDTYKRFLEAVDKAGIKTHIMAGIIPLKAAGMAKYMNQNVPGIDVPQHMIDRLAAAAAEGKEKGIKGLPVKLGIEMAAEMIAQIKAEGLGDGVHIMAIGAEKNVPVILEKAGIAI